MRSPWRAFALTAIAVIILDILTKIVVTRMLEPDSGRERVVVISNVAEFTYAENSGIAFGLLRGNSAIVWVLVVLATLGMTAIVWGTIGTASRKTAIAMGLVAGGGLANLFDRAVNGHVVDFISLWRWPSFNLADASIAVGVMALLLLVLRQERARRQ